MQTLTRIETLMQEQKTGWWEKLCEMIPLLKELERTPQSPDYHKEGDVAVHTRLAIEACPKGCNADLLWIALLHDIGKAETTIEHEDGRITAHSHAKVGTGMAESILTQLGMPMERQSRILWVIRHHMFHQSWQLKSSGDLTQRQRTYLIDPRFPMLLEFLRIDSIASKGKNDNLQVYEFYKNLLEGLPKI